MPSQSDILRAVVYRLNNTPVEELPRHVRYFATSIYNCKLSEGAKSETSDVGNDIVHKLKTKISSLLQDRSQEGRFTGIILAKAAIEAFGIQLVEESNVWVRSLLSCLNKVDCHEVKSICLTTIARSFILTKATPSLLREITTPCLPAFISSSLNLIKPTISEVDGANLRTLNPLLHPVLRSWHELIPHFASTFRPYVISIKSICLSLLSDDAHPSQIRIASSQVLALLHFCAPKNTTASEWSITCKNAIDATHEAADYVFRSVVEDWTSNTAQQSKINAKARTVAVVSAAVRDSLDLSQWTGIASGVLRLSSLLQLLKDILTHKQAQIMQIPISRVLNLCSRLSAVTIPTSKFALRSNPEIAREERHGLWLYLPFMHASVMSLLQALISAYGHALLPVSRTIIVQMWDIFEGESHHEEIRTATYSLAKSILKHQMFSMTKRDTAMMTLLLNACCSDLRQDIDMYSGHPQPQPLPSQSKTGSLEGSLIQSKQNPSPALQLSQKSLCYQSAWRLLPLAFTDATLDLLHSKVRATLDRTAILLNHHEAMLASVLNPPKSRNRNQRAPSSILPFLAASDYKSLAKEALLRPRMPMITSDAILQNAAPEENNDVEDEDMRTLTEATPLNTTEVLSKTNGDSEDSHMSTAYQPASSQPEDSTLKRDFASTIENNVDHQLRTSITDTTHIDHESEMKRARLHRESPPELEIAADEVQVEALALDLNTEMQADQTWPMSSTLHEDPHTAIAVTDVASSKQQGNKDATAAAAAAADNDESDFEMPTIDTTLSSDEEE